MNYKNIFIRAHLLKMIWFLSGIRLHFFRKEITAIFYKLLFYSENFNNSIISPENLRKKIYSKPITI